MELDSSKDWLETSSASTAMTISGEAFLSLSRSFSAFKLFSLSSSNLLTFNSKDIHGIGLVKRSARDIICVDDGDNLRRGFSISESRTEPDFPFCSNRTAISVSNFKE